MDDAKDSSFKKVDDMAYHLGSSDGSGNIITPIQLRGDNYDEWARAIRISLRPKRKFGFIDGSIKMPTSADKTDDWIAVQSMLVSWLMNTIDASIHSTLGEYEDARLLWINLKARLCVVNGTRICQLKTALGQCKQGAAEPVSMYFGRLSKIWEELHTYVKSPACRCGKCSCNIANQVETLRNEDQFNHFLLGLDRSYATIRDTFLGHDPLPSLDRAYQQVVQAERLPGSVSVAQEPRDGVVAFAVQSETLPKPGTGSVSEKFCNHFNWVGHDESSCFQLHGFPEWWGDRLRGGRGSGRGNGSRGGRGGGRSGVRGHSGGSVRANATIAGMSSGANNRVEGQDVVVGIASITAAQLQQLLEVLNTPKRQIHERLQGKSDKDSWIIDTGATNHMVCNPNFLHGAHDVPSWSVELPDGTVVAANKDGDVELPGGLMLKNVLCVPSLSCNLISVAQLIDDTSCVLQFTKYLCVIQDLLTSKVIGAGERRDGLYFFRGVSNVVLHKVDGDGSLDLWHQRMGHASEKALKFLPHVSGSIRKSSRACDVCHRAKHPRSSFPVSLNRANGLFELVHIDLWGPYKHPSSNGATYFLTNTLAVWVFLLKNKMEVHEMFFDFVALVKRQFDCNIKGVRGDNGIEFRFLDQYFREQGIVFETTCVGSQHFKLVHSFPHFFHSTIDLRFKVN